VIPSPADLLRFRVVAAAVLRLGGIVSFLASVYAAASWLLEGLRDQDLTNLDYYSDRAFQLVFFGVLGVVLVLRPARMASWLLPMPDSPACPSCGYTLRGLPAPTCPECGLALPPELMGSPVPEGQTTDSAWLARLRMLAVLTMRMVSLWLVITTIPASAELLIFNETTDYPTGLSQVVSYVIGLGLWLLAPTLARTCLHPRLLKKLRPEDRP
jgi:hypothetical protein